MRNDWRWPLRRFRVVKYQYQETNITCIMNIQVLHAISCVTLYLGFLYFSHAHPSCMYLRRENDMPQHHNLEGLTKHKKTASSPVYCHRFSPGNTLPTASDSFWRLTPCSLWRGSRLLSPALAIFSNNAANFLGLIPAYEAWRVLGTR